MDDETPYDFDDIPPPELPAELTAQRESVHALGYDREAYYYYSTSKRMVTALSAPEHTRAHLSGIASAAHYWEREFDTMMTKNNGLSWAHLADHLMTECRLRGIYDPSRIRGRGAWLENDTPILHIGDALIINGQRSPLIVPGSRYIYEADAALLDQISGPLATTDAHWLVKVCKLLRWEAPVNGTLLAGWLAIAPICGALQWRPSIWLTASSGAGKSWVMDNIVNVCLQQVALYVAFNTTEPGIRQALQADARPVVFDEAERDSAAAAFRMDEILGYQRVASSENSVEIVKGDTGGRAKKYKPRSVFLFQSINTGISKKSDEGRVTVLSLRDYSVASDTNFEDLEATCAERITPEFASGLISRSVSLIPVIRENSKTFARAISAHLGSRRFGDQLGTLLAGAYSLHSTGLITPEQAAEYVAREQWDAQAPAEDEKDEYRLLRHIMAVRLRIGSVEMPVSRLLEAAQQFQQQEGLPAPEIAQRVLSEAGIKYGAHENVPGVFISVNHPQMKAMLRDTDWSASWGRALGRLPGALAGREIKTVRFSMGHVGRAVWIPMSTVDPQ
jgi:putative DNA primase/helicase